MPRAWSPSVRLKTSLASLLVVSAAAAQPVSHDYDQDGASDFLVSVTGFDASQPVGGAVRIWSGSSKTILTTVASVQTNTLFGWSTGSAGDLNGDGFDDFAVGEPLWSSNQMFAGRVMVFSGADDALLLAVGGPYQETGLGRYVAGVGDWNGDGTPDIAASGWDVADLDSDGTSDHAAGMVFVVSGFDGSILAEIGDPGVSEMFGYAVFGLGDVTGDNLADIAVLDPAAPAAQGSSGVLYIFSGQASPQAITVADSHSTVTNNDPTLRGFAAQVDVMHPDLWLNEPVLQIVSLTNAGSSGVNHAPCRIDLVTLSGSAAGSKGLRPSLVLAGDVNLDGLVDATDLQQSISQLGTDPQALGVMPIADMDQDGMVDTDDVAMVLATYGQTTDVYQGLWDGSRLLGIAGGSAGFGSVGGGVIGGSGQVEPGPRPIDDCPPVTPSPSPYLFPAYMLPTLLDQDLRVNCAGCPDRDEPDPEGCWICDENGSLTGGTVEVIPAQPNPGEPFYFMASGVEDSGGKEKCTCAAETRNVPPGDIGYSHIVVQQNADGSWPPAPSIGHPGWIPGDVTAELVSAEACTKFRAYFKVDSIRDCPPPTRVINGTADVAEFEYRLKCYADESSRTRLGLREPVKITIEPPGTFVQMRKISGGGVLTRRDSGNYWDFRANTVADSTVVEIESGGCTRRVTFTSVEPNGIKMHQQPAIVHHATEASAGFIWCIQVEPLDVSFRYIYIYEGVAANLTATGGLAIWANWTHLTWSTNVGCDNFAEKTDTAYSGSVVAPPGGVYVAGRWDVDLPWHWKLGLNAARHPQPFAWLHVYSELEANGTLTHSKGTCTVTMPWGPPQVGLPLAYPPCPLHQEPANDFEPCN